MEYMSFNRFLIAVSLISILVIQRLVCLAHQATPLNLIKPIHDDMNMENLAFVNHLQFIRSNYHKDDNKKSNDVNNHNNNNILNEIHQHHQQHHHPHPHHNHKNKHQPESSSPSSAPSSSEPSSVHLSYFPMSVLSFELNERQGCLEANNYSVIETFSAINKGEIVLKIRGFKIDLVLNSGHYKGGSTFLKQDNNQNNAEATLYHQKNSATIKNNNNQKHQEPMQNECHGHGFSIYDCEPFDIEPQHERRIRVGFSPDFTLTKYVAYLTLLTNLDFEYTIKLKASVPLPLVAACNQSLPRPDWEPTLRYIFPVGILVLISAVVSTAYMKASNVKGQRVPTSSSSYNGQTNSLSNHHNGGSKDYDRSNNCSNNNNNNSNSNNNHHHGHHGVTSPISPQVLANQNNSNNSSFNGLSPGNGRNNSMNSNKSNKGPNNNNNNNNNSNPKRRKNSSSVNSEKVPTNSINNNNNNNITNNTSNKDNNNNKSFATSSSSSSTTSNQNNNDKKVSSPYAPMFQNLTNVIASPPPPLPTFKNDYDPLEFKKLRGKKSGKKSNSLNGSIASNDDIGNQNSLCSSTNHMTSSLISTSSTSSSSASSTTSSNKSNNNQYNNKDGISNNNKRNGKFSSIIKATGNGSGSSNSSFNGESGRECDLIMQTSTSLTTPLRDVFNNHQIIGTSKQLDLVNRKGSLRDVFNNASSLSDDDQETCQDFVKNSSKLYTKKSSSIFSSASMSMSKSALLVDAAHNRQQQQHESFLRHHLLQQNLHNHHQLRHNHHQCSPSSSSQFVTNGVTTSLRKSGHGASVTPIQPPSSLSSTPSSSVPSATSSTSSSPPLSASSYGEYSLLGPGATFELPCLRVRSTHSNTLTQ